MKNLTQYISEFLVKNHVGNNTIFKDIIDAIVNDKTFPKEFTDTYLLATKYCSGKKLDPVNAKDILYTMTIRWDDEERNEKHISDEHKFKYAMYLMNGYNRYAQKFFDCINSIKEGKLKYNDIIKKYKIKNIDYDKQQFTVEVNVAKLHLPSGNTKLMTIQFLEGKQ